MKKALYVALALVLALGLVIPLAGCGAVGESDLQLDGRFVALDGQAGTTLTAGLDVTPHWTLTYHWTIDKSVTPDTWDLFGGDTGTSQYTVRVTKDAGTEEAWVDGIIWVNNGGARATENLAITAELQDGYEPPNDFLTSAPVDVSGNPVLDPGETGYYAYHVMIPITDGPFPQPHALGTYKVTAHVAITNHSGHLGVPFGPNPSATTVWPASKTLINNSINVDDTNGHSWWTDSSVSWMYEKTFSCADEGTNDNTATILETGQSDTASVTVNCYALEVAKTAETSFDRTYNWTIDKSADQSALTLAKTESYLVNYQVCVDVTGSVDSDWLVTGAISVSNPAPIEAELIGVADEVSPDIAVVADFGAITFPYPLDAEGHVAGTYVANLPDASTRTNTATATIQNYAYKWDGTAEAIGTTDFSSDPVSVDFSSATMNEVDECVAVSDDYAGSLGTVCLGDAPKCFSYQRTIGPYGTCGDYTVSNTASFVTNDTGDTDNDSWTVNVRVPCAGGCTLTIGYWKNHAGLGNGRQSDMVTAKLPILLGSSGGAKTQTVSTAALAVQFLGFKGSNNVFDASNGINKVYAQLLGAKLNIASGASNSAVLSTINAADAFLATKNSLDWAGLSKTQKNQVLGWMSTLDNYNNGLIGPGHCSE
jgi:hypothetical protein